MMVDVVSAVAIIFCIILGLYAYRALSRYSGTPPGPWGLPVLGYFPFLTKTPHLEFNRLAKKYGGVFSIKIGFRYVIILNTYDAIKEAFVKYGDVYAGKLTDSIEAKFGEYKSVFVTDGEIWREQRRFLLSAMRDFGFGRVGMEENIRTEAQEGVQALKATQGKPFDMMQLTISLTGNAIANLIFGRRFSDEEAKIMRQIFIITDEFEFFNFVESIPMLTYLPDKLTGMDRIFKLQSKFFQFVEKMTLEHEKTFDENYVRDLIDVYLMKRRQLETQGDKQDKNQTIYSKDYMRVNITLLFGAGVETTSKTLAWMFSLAAAYPAYQRRVQKEIDDRIGRERFPTMNDRSQMPFTEAMLLEMQRYITLLPQTFYHRTTEDSQLEGYRIPKDTPVLANIWNVHHDPKIWKEPQSFKPERFLGDDGKINKLREYVIPFSIGKRNCLGESLAKAEIFIYFVTFLQNFFFQSPAGKTITAEHDYFNHQSNLNSYEVCAIARN